MMDTPIIPSNTPYNLNVYEPAEDSFLLLDALEQDLPTWLPTRPLSKDGTLDTPELICLEVGCGSGIATTALANFTLNSQQIVPCVLALDVNPSACLLTKATSEVNNVGNKVEPILLDGTSSLQSFRCPIFDVIVCNPPYVPVSVQEKEQEHCQVVDPKSWKLLEKSWDGGPDGNEFIIPFLKSVPSILNDSGALYLLLSSWNDPENLMETVAVSSGLQGNLVIKRNAGRERLSVWRLTKIPKSNN